MKIKEEKALLHAISVWGVYYNDKHPDISIDNTLGQITIKDYLSGYNQAVEDSKSKELLNQLTKLYNAIDSCVELTPELLQETQQLIKEATKIIK